MSDDLLAFADENTPPEQPADPLTKPWYVLVVDDDEDVHQVTRLVLSHFTVEGQPLELLNARDMPTARRLLQENSDIALAILDVVMETDDSGLQLARYIREDLNNHFTRIVLRTGQPGQAPEADVVVRYDINDYKEKTELTTQKLRTLCISSIRSYRDICQIDEHRQGLLRLINTTSEMFESTQLETFASIILEQIMVLLRVRKDALYCQLIQHHPRVNDQPEFHVLAASGEHKHLVNRQLDNELSPEILASMRQALQEKHSIFAPHSVTGYYRTQSGNENLLYVATGRTLSDLDKELLDLYSRQVALAYEQIQRNQP